MTKSAISEEEKVSCSRSWIKSTLKAFSLSFWSTSLSDWLVVGPPNTVKVLGLFSDELLLVLMMDFRYSKGLLYLSASNSVEDREMAVNIEGLETLVAVSAFKVPLGCSGVC